MVLLPQLEVQDGLGLLVGVLHFDGEVLAGLEMPHRELLAEDDTCVLQSALLALDGEEAVAERQGRKAAV